MATKKLRRKLPFFIGGGGEVVYDESFDFQQTEVDVEINDSSTDFDFIGTELTVEIQGA